MTIYQECPRCKVKQSNVNKKCSCGEDLDKAKRSNRVQYWLYYRDANRKQIKECVSAVEGLNPYSIEEAKIAHSRRVMQKREGQIIKESSRLTFNKLTDWYLKLETVQGLASYDIIKINLRKFNQVFGNRLVRDITPADLQNYQEQRKREGKAPGTIDHEIGKAKTMINKARENDLVTGKTKKAFDRIKKTLVSGSDVRDRILSKDEFEALVEHSRNYLKGMVIMAYYTGMRRGEILALTWGHVDLEARVIRLEATDTKSGKPREVPVCEELHKYLDSIKKKRAGKHKHVFLYRGKPIKGDVRASLKIACQKAGISYGRFVKNGFIFHDLRHTFNTNMRKAGVQESVIMDITGHTTREMFDRYNTVDKEDRQNALEMLQKFINSTADATQSATLKNPPSQDPPKSTT
ncbi:tyrosine-type recombinase/integrase [Thermodesulfobacteriota bacterium]